MSDFNDSSIPDTIVAELGGTETGLAGQVSIFWDLFLPYATTPILRYYYTKRAGINFLLGAYRKKFNSKTGDVSVNLREQFQNLLAMKEELEKELGQFLAQTVNSVDPAQGELIHKNPYEFDGVSFGPNDLIYRGNAAYRRPSNQRLTDE
jgi:hypothetical protein